MESPAPSAPPFESDWYCWPLGSTEYYPPAPPPPYSEVNPAEPQDSSSSIRGLSSSETPPNSSRSTSSCSRSLLSSRTSTCVSESSVFSIMETNDRLARRGLWNARIEAFEIDEEEIRSCLSEVAGSSSSSTAEEQRGSRDVKYIRRNAPDATLEYLVFPAISKKEIERIYKRCRTAENDGQYSPRDITVKNITALYAYKYCLKSSLEDRETFTRTEPYQPGESLEQDEVFGSAALCSISCDEQSGVCVRIPNTSKKIKCSTACQNGSKRIAFCSKCCGSGYYVEFEVERVQRTKIKHYYHTVVEGLSQNKLKHAKGYSVFHEKRSRVNPVTEHDVINQDVINASNHLVRSHRNRGKIIRQSHSVTLIPVLRATMTDDRSRSFWLIGKDRQPFMESL